MKQYAAIEQRYGFALPEIYRTLELRGHFSHRGPEENYLAFYDCEWLPMAAIAEYRFNDWEIATDGGFVPFAITGRHEPYCWRLDWAVGGEAPIVLCERCERAVCLAPDFRGFVYRMALEAFAGRNDFPGDAKVDELHRAVAILAPLLPEQWSARLLNLRGRSWQKDEKLGNLCVIPWQECEDIIAADLAFPHLNEAFIHDKGYLKRLRERAQ
jgi:hypothetical protein